MNRLPIKIWRKIVSLAAVQGVRRVHLPKPVSFGLLAFSTITFSLMTLSFTIGSVLHQPGYERVAFAIPAHQSRLIRQAEVAQFGTRVSDAFGIRNAVATEFADWILEASERQELSPELLASLVITESSFRKSVRSHVGAVGPTQVRPDYWGKFCGDAELTDPEQNVYCGAQVLSYLFERCDGDQACALAAYNTGPYSSRVGAGKRYVSKVDRYLSSFSASSAL